MAIPPTAADTLKTRNLKMAFGKRQGIAKVSPVDPLEIMNICKWFHRYLSTSSPAISVRMQQIDQQRHQREIENILPAAQFPKKKVVNHDRLECKCLIGVYL